MTALHFQFGPASGGPVWGYQLCSWDSAGERTACVFQQSNARNFPTDWIPQGTREVRARGISSHEMGPWSEPILLPELPVKYGLVACLLVLIFIGIWRARR